MTKYNSYWNKRKNLYYYKYVITIINILASDSKSIIDVGSRNTPLLEEFDWIPKRVTIDKELPYKSNNVYGLKADFLTIQPKNKYDFAVCLQVLEHIENVEKFTKHLFNIADNVLISVPYKWPKNSSKFHIHDPVDLTKLYAWTNRKPNYHIVVTEPFSGPSGRRLIAFYSNNPNFLIANYKNEYKLKYIT